MGAAFGFDTPFNTLNTHRGDESIEYTGVGNFGADVVEYGGDLFIHVFDEGVLDGVDEAGEGIGGGAGGHGVSPILSL
jgi:hypothetical protein